jgi:hypothetical protein
MGCYKTNVRKFVAVSCIRFLFYDAVSLATCNGGKKLTLFFMQYYVRKLPFLLKKSD